PTTHPLFPYTTLFRSSAAGTVTGTGPRGAYGLQVAVAHPDIGAGLSTSYSHLSAIDVAPGAHVQRGQQVGRVGTTGMSTGCHLRSEEHTSELQSRFDL